MYEKGACPVSSSVRGVQPSPYLTPRDTMDWGCWGVPKDRLAEMEDKLWILEDLNMMYIRQIAHSLEDTDIQKKIDHEVRMREGACKLLAMCSQREQALEAAKSLLVCSSRIMAYMSELQRLKEAQVMQRMTRRPSDAGPLDDRLPCRGRVSISDLRIPLMWKDTEYFKNKGDMHRCAVFCLLQVGVEIYDTGMVMVDRTVTDICFENGIVFTDAGPEFDMKVEIYSCGTEDDFSLTNTPKKLASKLSNSLGRSSGKRVRASLEGVGSVTNGGGSPMVLPAPNVSGPKYHLLAHTQLSLTDVQDSFRTHDLTTTSNEESSFWLPLYGSMCCRLAAQPTCMCDQMMSGFLKMQQQVGEHQHWVRMFCVLRGSNLCCYRRQDDVETKVEPALTIAINKETRIRATDKDPKNKLQSMSITNRYGGDEVTHTLLAESRADMQRWMEAFWQHFYDMSQWKQCCDEVMKIEDPSPRKPPAMLSKQGSLYHEMAIDGADDIGTVTDILAQKMKEFELQRGLQTPPWVSLYESAPKPSTSTTHLTSSTASIASDSDSAYSASPCMSRASPGKAAAPNGTAKEAGRTPREQHWSRPRTLSLDAKLTSLKNRAMRAEATPRKRAVVVPCSSSSSSGSTTPDSESISFSRPAAARQSLRNIRAKLDPRNWLQSQV